MSEKFNLEIISPDQILINTEVKEVIIPAYEGLMTILKDHINLVTFLRPGFIIIDDDKTEEFFVEEGTVEFLNNTLLILSSTIKNIKDLTTNEINEMIQKTEINIQKNEIKDKEKYILSYKLETLKQIER